MDDYLFSENEMNRKDRVFFLCGVKFQSHSSDKRVVLKNYIESLNKIYKVIILEENFVFKKNEKGYLAYDDIFMKDLNQVETLTALFSDFVFIIHESISTSAELGMFATNELIAPKVILLIPEEIAIEENKTSGFIDMAFFKNKEDQKIRKIFFNPSLEIWKKSEYKIDYRTYFSNNEIGTNLSKNINNLILAKSQYKDKVMIKKNIYKNFFNKPDILSYYLDIKNNKIYVKVSAQILRIHILSLFNIDDFKNNLRKNKKIVEHINYIKNVYEKILKETIQEKEGKEFNSIIINIMENHISGTSIKIEIQQAIGYYLYLLQAMKWISLQQDDENIDFRKISISMEFEEIYKEYKIFIFKKENTLFRKEFESEQ